MRKKLLLFYVLMLTTTAVFPYAGSNAFFGPYLGNAAENMQRNRFIFQPFYFYTVTKNSQLDDLALNTTASNTLSNTFAFFSALGVTDFLDAAVYTAFNHAVRESNHFTAMGDTNLTLGFQVFKQNLADMIPNFRITLQQTIPTGRFAYLSPGLNGTDSTGIGSYQTNLGLNFSYEIEPFTGHTALSTLNLNYLYAAPTTVHGLNAFGGDANTHGDVYPGNLISLDYNFEIVLTGPWNVFFETFIAHRQAATFTANAIDNTADENSVGTPAFDQFSLMPGVAYNFNKTLGLLGGYWFTIGGGANNPKFQAPSLSFYYIME